MQRLRYHLAAIALFCAVGLISTFNWLISGRPLYWGSVADMIGTRFTGYGALFLLGLALIIGPLARIRPQLFARWVAYRRAIGIWSVVGSAVHLVYAVRFMDSFNPDPWWQLFVNRYVGHMQDGTRLVRYMMAIHRPEQAVAWVGLAGFVVLLLVALASNDQAQRRLGPAWKFVQQWAYTGFALIAGHVLIMKFAGKFKGSPPLSPLATWWLLVVLVLQAAGMIYTIKRHRQRKDNAA